MAAWVIYILVASCLYNLLNAQFQPARECFGRSHEAVDACRCDENSIDFFNNYKVFPLLQKLLTRDFFRFYKVNMERTCPFWPDDRQCISKECGIGYCDDEVPSALKQPASISVVRLASNRTSFKNEPLIVQIGGGRCDSEASNTFDPLDTTLTEGDRQQLSDMDWHDDNEDKFCDFEDEASIDMHYVDLSRNPERYTGYKGSSAQKTEYEIRQEFSSSAQCLSIIEAPGGFGDGTWFRNVKLFKDRFGTKWTSEGPERLKNVYFVFLFELRAIVKAAPYLRKELFYTGNAKEDAETRAAVEALINISKEFKYPFDETEMFTGVEAQARQLREEFRVHFYNISRIMDCVECDKCRLWGKLQTHGMGTALKILFSDLPTSHYRSKDGTLYPPFQLTRNEVVSLFQSFGRYSSSIREVEEFRQAILKEPS